MGMCCCKCALFADDLDDDFLTMSDKWDFYGDPFSYQPLATTGASAIAIAKKRKSSPTMAVRLISAGAQEPPAPPRLDQTFAMGAVLCWQDEDNYLVAEVELRTSDAGGGLVRTEAWLRLAQVAAAVETTLEEYYLDGTGGTDEWSASMDLQAGYDANTQEFHAVRGTPVSGVDQEDMKLSVGPVVATGARSGLRMRAASNTEITATSFELSHHSQDCISRCAVCAMGETPDFVDVEFNSACASYNFRGLWNHHGFSRCEYGIMYHFGSGTTDVIDPEERFPLGPGYHWVITHEKDVALNAVVRTMRQYHQSTCGFGPCLVAEATHTVASCMDDSIDIPVTRFEPKPGVLSYCDWETITVRPGKL